MFQYSMTNDRTTYNTVAAVHFRAAYVEHKWILSGCNKREMYCIYNHIKEDTNATYSILCPINVEIGEDYLLSYEMAVPNCQTVPQHTHHPQMQRIYRYHYSTCTTHCQV